jgi:tetratricopeptide (TPR) repeat protein
MHKSIILSFTLFFLSISFLMSNYTYSNNSNDNQLNYYDSLYNQSVLLIKDNKVEKSIILLTEVISKQRSYKKEDDILIMNAHYDLGQIYLSRISNYDKAVTQFEYIFNNVYAGYESENINSKMRSLLDLKEKSLFMLGYIYHNHIGNFTIAQNYYSTFLNKFPENELSSSVKYELDIINKEIKSFNK